MACACKGSCCAVFTFLDPADPRFDNTADADFIRDMLIPLDLVEAADRLAALDIEPPYGDEAHYGWDGFSLTQPERRLATCRHWDTETRLCTAYDQRPAMCRFYPYGNECDYGCGYELGYRDAWDHALWSGGAEAGTPLNIIRAEN